MKILVVFGTRPEAIKMAPVVVQLRKYFGKDVKVCVTGQHRSMLDQVLSLFNITPDYDLNIMTGGQSLSHITCTALKGLEEVLKQDRPDRILVHGDTTTTFVASLAGFYQQIPVDHIEAGLRSNNMHSPWPEEMNRKVTSCLADLHFAPTEMAADNLIKEGIDSNRIFVTGNTVVDALLQTSSLINESTKLANDLQEKFSYLDLNKKLILVTGHRRENFGQGLEQICLALNEIAHTKNDTEILYPVHLNPNVQNVVKNKLQNQKNIFLIEPQDYLSFVYLMKRSYLILTDSGGVQEEAPTFGKPVLVMRDNTERPEAILGGTSKVVGCKAQNIVKETLKLVNDRQFYNKVSVVSHVYGDGHAAQRIADTLINVRGVA